MAARTRGAETGASDKPRPEYDFVKGVDHMTQLEKGIAFLYQAALEEMGILADVTCVIPSERERVKDDSSEEHPA